MAVTFNCLIFEVLQRSSQTKTNKMTTEKTYNGWSNYATWRIALENFDGVSKKESLLYTAEACKEYVEFETELMNDNELTLSYALAFLDQVNWHEILEHLED